jgi:hypothetical protein
MGSQGRGLRSVLGEQREVAKQAGFWEELDLRMRKGQVIPILGNSVRNDRIFDVDYDYDLGPADGEPDPHAAQLNVEEELAEIWAEGIGYPLPDKHRLARVAVYNQVKSRDRAEAKGKYLRFLKGCLLGVAKGDDRVADQVDELESQVGSLSFSHIASTLGYPRFTQEHPDPLRLLARLPLPIYVTTSYYDFMERALSAEGKSPRSQICVWWVDPAERGSVGLSAEHKTDPDFVPGPESPLVYHLNGLEEYPESLVLSEDDYLDFLVRVSEEGKDSEAPLIPLHLSAALAQSSLLLLGYRLQDWDFRVLFRGLIKAKRTSLRKFSIAIQLDPLEQREITNSKEARGYLKDYFIAEKFEVEWGSTDSFVQKLYQQWDEWRDRV